MSTGRLRSATSAQRVSAAVCAGTGRTMRSWPVRRRTQPSPLARPVVQVVAESSRSNRGYDLRLTRIPCSHAEPDDVSPLAVQAWSVQPCAPCIACLLRVRSTHGLQTVSSVFCSICCLPAASDRVVVLRRGVIPFARNAVACILAVTDCVHACLRYLLPTHPTHSIANADLRAQPSTSGSLTLRPPLSGPLPSPLPRPHPVVCPGVLARARLSSRVCHAACTLRSVLFLSYV